MGDLGLVPIARAPLTPKRGIWGCCVPVCSHPRVLTPSPSPPQAQPTDMRALQDFEEPDKLHIQMNDIITVIEGRYCTAGEGTCQPAGGRGTPKTGVGTAHPAAPSVGT